MLIPVSSIALAAGFLLDLLLGDPRGWPHLVRAMGGYALPHCLRITIGTAEECQLVIDGLTAFAKQG